MYSSDCFMICSHVSHMHPMVFNNGHLVLILFVMVPESQKLKPSLNKPIYNNANQLVDYDAMEPGMPTYEVRLSEYVNFIYCV